MESTTPLVSEIGETKCIWLDSNTSQTSIILMDEGILEREVSKLNQLEKSFEELDINTDPNSIGTIILILTLTFFVLLFYLAYHSLATSIC